MDTSSPNASTSIPQSPQPPIVEQSPPPSSRLTLISAGIVTLLLLGAGAYFFLAPSAPATPSVSDEKIVRIGLSLDSVKIQRWADERDIMVEKATKMNATVTTYSAEGDDATQISQIENFISQKVDAIIVVAHDANALGPVITQAQQAGIKVINYDRLTGSSTPDLYLSFDSVKVGTYAAQYVIDAIGKDKKVPNIAYVGGSPTDRNTYYVLEGAMGVLDPLVQEGKINLVFNEFTKDWSPSEAYLNFKKFLDGGGKVDGVVTAYDGLAYGVVQALAEKKIEGAIPVSGQNGELQAVQRIVKGTQTMTAYKPGRPLAEKAVEAAVDFSHGRNPETNGVVNNGVADIKAYLFDPIPVTKDNIRTTVIKDGTFTESEIYGGATP
ncbi:MAG: substrate-binding domain-containing protein [Minisyncoccia bacterium]